MLPPFTDLRTVQTLVDGDKLLHRYGAQDLSPHDARRLHRRDLRRDAGQARLHLRGGRALASGAQYHGEDDALVNAKVQGGAAGTALDADPVRRRGPGGPRGRRARRAHARASSTAALDGRHRRAGRAASSSPTSRSGRSAPARSPPRRTRRRSAARSATRLAELYAGDAADGVRILYGGSVKAGNVAAIMAQPDVDGALVGGRQPRRRGVRLDLPLPRPRDRRVVRRPAPRRPVGCATGLPGAPGRCGRAAQPPARCGRWS